MKYCTYFQAGLIVVLIVTLMINISFIIETNKKLKRDQIRGRFNLFLVEISYILVEIYRNYVKKENLYSFDSLNLQKC